MNKILLLALVSGISTVAIAADSYVAVSKSPIESINNTTTSLVINSTFLDNAWLTRDNPKTQEKLVKFIITNPSYDKSDYVICWKLSRLVSYLGNFGYGYKHILKEPTPGIAFFKYGYQAGKDAIDIKPQGVEANYWYAINLGSYGLLKGIISAASSASTGMDSLKIVKDSPTQNNYDNYGAYRILGRYYQELPSVFGGDDAKAEELLKTSVAKSNGFVKNYIFLGNFYLHRKQYQDALVQCNSALTTKNDTDTNSERARDTKEANECITQAKANITQP